MNSLDFKRKKKSGEKITVLTCYDYTAACILAESNIDCVLVGDSVAMTIHGHPSTVMATMEMMVMHTSAVARGLKKQFLISDLPFLCHRKSLSDSIEHVKALFQAGAHAVKIEGADTKTCELIHHLTQSGIPIMGHIGLTPQAIHQLGGYIVQGKEREQADLLFKQAQNLQNAGCFAIVLECIPGELAEKISQSLDIPTIGIGAGAGTDGQVLVWQDFLGAHDFKPKFVKQFAQLKYEALQAINTYVKEVQEASFPNPDYTFGASYGID